LTVCLRFNRHYMHLRIIQKLSYILAWITWNRFYFLAIKCYTYLTLALKSAWKTSSSSSTSTTTTCGIWARRPPIIKLLPVLSSTCNVRGPNRRGVTTMSPRQLDPGGGGGGSGGGARDNRCCARSVEHTGSLIWRRVMYLDLSRDRRMLGDTNSRRLGRCLDVEMTW